MLSSSFGGRPARARTARACSTARERADRACHFVRIRARASYCPMRRVAPSPSHSGHTITRWQTCRRSYRIWQIHALRIADIGLRLRGQRRGDKDRRVPDPVMERTRGANAGSQLEWR
uniref:Uncharacterized protein n=1 Tax=Aegilops tauschii subsp. strangulata TaxID=200361 RepID=A0A453I775_AEGTS